MSSVSYLRIVLQSQNPVWILLVLFLFAGVGGWQEGLVGGVDARTSHETTDVSAGLLRPDILHRKYMLHCEQRCLTTQVSLRQVPAVSNMETTWSVNTSP